MSYNVKQVIVVRKDLNMRKGKMCAQVAHASMMFILAKNTLQGVDVVNAALSRDEAAWLHGSFAKVVVSVDSEDELNALMFQAAEMNVTCHPVVDRGMTEFHGVPTLTCAAFGPEKSEVLDKLTGNLKLL